MSFAKEGTDINQSLVYAFSYSPLLKSTLEGKDRSEFEREVAEASFYPTIGVWAGLGAMQESSQQDRKYDYFDDVVGVGKAGLGASQILFDGFRRKYELEKNTVNIRSKVYQALDVASTLAYATISAHMDILRRKELVQASEENYIAHEKLVKLLQARYNDGLSGIGDVEQGKARMLKVQAALIRQKNALLTAHSNYYRITGVSATNVLLPVFAPYNRYESVEEVKDLALINNHQILVASAQIEQAQAATNASKSNYYPQITGDVNTSYQSADTNYDNNIYALDAGVNMRWNLYNGGADKAQVSANAASTREARQLLQHTKDLVFEQIEVTLEQTKSAKEELKFYEAAQRSSNISRVNFYEQYKVGQKGLLNLLDAEAEYFTAKVETIIARTDVILGQYRLHALAGVLLTELNLEQVLRDSSVDPAQIPILEILNSQLP